MTDALATARRALADAGPGTLVTVTRERSTMLRFARSRPTQATSVDDVTVEVAVCHGGHVGRAATNRVDRDALADCARGARRTAEAAAATAGEGRYPGFPAPSTPRGHDGHDAATAALPPAVGAAALTAAFEVADRSGVEAGGIWTAGEVETAIAATSGIELSDRVTDAFMKVIATAPSGRTGYAARTAVAASAIDATALAERAAAKATVADAAVALAPGEYPAVLEPPAVAELLWVLAETAFDGRAHGEGRGALSDRLGTRVAAPAINLSDSPRYAATLPRAFDAEGVPKAPLPLIQDGVANRVVHDVHSATVAGPGAHSTGHALVAGGQAAPPQPTNLVLIGGGAGGEDELREPLRHGIQVTRLWYSNVLRPTEARFTAVTRDGTFLIQDGQLTRPLHDVRITDSALDMLARAEALGARAELTSDGEFYGRRFATGSICPPLRTTVTVSGGAGG